MSPTPVKKVIQKITSKLDLSNIKDLDRGMLLKVAVVRNGKVLASQIIDVKKARDLSSIPVEIGFEAPERKLPLGVTLSVGPNVPDEEFAGIETYNQWISHKDPGWKKLNYNLEKLIVPERLYPWWWRWCRTYTIRGKVVCPDGSPVPGANVTAIDVDRFWIWCGTSSIGSAVTDVDGTFEITFRWCCYWWWWWLPLKLYPLPPRLKIPPPPVLKQWSIDPYLADRIEKLLQKVPHLPPRPRPDPAPSIEPLQTLARHLERAVPESKSIAAPVESVDALGKILTARLSAAAELKLLHVWPWWPWPWHDCTPDIIFKVTQDCNDADTVIYEETCADTRWNIAPLLDGITLVANDKACCSYDPQVPEGNCFVFGEVGCTPVDVIGGNDPLAPVAPDFLGYAYPTTLDRPFGGNLSIHGVFGDLSNVDYYAVHFSPDGVGFTEMTGEMQVSFIRKYWGEPPGGGPAQWNTIVFEKKDIDGHWVFKTREKYEDENPCVAPGTCWGNHKIWTYHADHLITWISSTLPDGLYYLKVVGYNINAAGHLINERIMPVCDGTSDSSLIIRIDNRNIGAGYHAPSTPTHPCGDATVHLCTEEPDCDFKSIVVNEGTADQQEVNACDIVRLNPTDTVTIHFNVSVPATPTDGHLAAYEMTAHYGESGYFDILTHGVLAADPDDKFGPTYAIATAPPQNAVRPFWYGGNFKVTLHGSDFPACCAYLLKLRAWKRTTHGCINPYHFHYNRCEISFTVLKPELCPDICPPPLQLKAADITIREGSGNMVATGTLEDAVSKAASSVMNLKKK